ncbi:hypothetical protein [Candidatus Nanohalococcus occultus]|uniref:hypothetical protein n=1 Tax=Candidatus Nanohalococcus occultus TaxID=2978047 RepID=UPI0039DF824D
MKGSIAIGTILAIVAAFGAAGTVMTAYTDGPIADIIDQGTEAIGQQSDYTVDVANKQDISDLAMLVYQRGSNDGCRYDTDENGELLCKQGMHPMVCYQNNPSQRNFDVKKKGYWPQSGYPALADTYLGQYPDCYGARSTGLGQTGVAQRTGQDMEGIFSRERFTVKETITLTSNDDSTYLESKLKGFSDKSYDRWAELCEGTVLSSQSYTLYFDVEQDIDGRASDWSVNDLENSPYCGGEQEVSGSETVKGLDGKDSVKLCKGDKGYIQINKGSPTNDGEAGEEYGTGNAPKFARIVITEVEEPNCGSVTGVQPDGPTSSPYMALRVNYRQFPTKTRQMALSFSASGWTTAFYEWHEPTNSQCALHFMDNDPNSFDDPGGVYYWNGTVIQHDGTFPPVNSAEVSSTAFSVSHNFEKGSGDLYRDKLVAEGFSDETVDSTEIDFLKGSKKDSDQVFQPYGDLICGDLASDNRQRSVWAVCDEALPEPRRVKVHEQGEEKTYVCEPGNRKWVEQ